MITSRFRTSRQRLECAGLPALFCRSICLLFALFVVCTVRAADTVITAHIVLTNNPANNDTLIVNGDTRTFKTTATAPATQIGIGGDYPTTSTNVYNQLGAYPFTGPLSLGRITNGVSLMGTNNQALTVTLSSTNGTVTYYTNTITRQYPLLLPLSATVASARTNQANWIVDALNDWPTTALSSTSPALTNHVSLAATQTITGAKTFSGATTLQNTSTLISGGTLTNLDLRFAQTTWYTSNTVANIGWYLRDSLGNYVSAIAPDTSGYPSIYDVTSDMYPHVAPSYSPNSENILTRGIANNTFAALASANTFTATNSIAQLTNSLITGSTITNTTISGTISTLTSGTISGVTVTNATLYGTAGTLDGLTVTNAAISGTISTLTSGTVSGSTITNATLRNVTIANTNTVTGQWIFARVASDTLANGNNSGLNWGDASYVHIIPGPTGAFTICGITGGTDGRLLIVQNDTAQNMTLAHQSGTDPTPANRIITNTGADRATTGNGTAILLYNDTRWILISLAE